MKKTPFQIVLGILIILYSCEKDKVHISKNNLETFFNDYKKTSTFFQVNIKKDTTVTDGSVFINIPAHAFGAKADSTILIALKSVTAKSEMILERKPTSTLYQPLISGGEMQLRVMDTDSQKVEQKKPIEVGVWIDEETIYEDMEVFEGSENECGEFYWNNQDIPFFNTVIDNEPAYMAEMDNLNVDWINCDRFYDSGVPQVNFTIELNEELLYESLEIFLVFEEINSVLTVYSVSDWSHWNDQGIDSPLSNCLPQIEERERMVSFEAVNIPEHYKCTIFSMAEDVNGQLYMSKKRMTTQKNKKERIQFNPVSEKELLKAIKTLD